MEFNDMDGLDDIIEAALRDESLREVPSGFHQRMAGRLRVTALAKSERQGFHFRMAATAMVFAVLGVVLIGVPVLAFYQGWMVHSVPGAMGYFDYLVVFAVQYWGEIAVILGGATGVAAVAAATTLALPRLRRRAQQH